MLSLARVAGLEWENSSKIPIEALCVANSTSKRDQLSSFTEVLERFEVCPVSDKMKISDQKTGVIETCRPDLEECPELQRVYDRILGHEYQSCLSRPALRAELKNNLSRAKDGWTEDGDGGDIVPLRESDTERKSDAQ